MKKIIKVIFRILGFCLLLVGIFLFVYPNLNEFLLERQTKAYVQDFDEKYQVNQTEKQKENTKDSSKQEKKTKKNKTSNKTSKIVSKKEKDALLEEIKAYNKEIYKNKQETFKDAWTYAQSPMFLKHLDYGKFGYIKIPAMNVCLPLYLGASDSHMAHGAAVLGGTSIPVGGKNTNSAIVGHRGWSTGRFFKYIERLKIGHHVYITNPFGTLTYEVEKIQIIDPSDVETIKIQKGRDLITLVTCHPYATHGKQRYLVFCKRVKNGNYKDLEESNTKNEQTTVSKNKKKDKKESSQQLDTSLDESSEMDIKKEEQFRLGCTILISIMILLTIGSSIIRWIKRKK